MIGKRSLLGRKSFLKASRSKLPRFLIRLFTKLTLLRRGNKGRFLIRWIVLNPSLSLWRKLGLKLDHLARKKVLTLMPTKSVIFIFNASKSRTSSTINQKNQYPAFFSSINKTAKT